MIDKKKRVFKEVTRVHCLVLRNLDTDKVRRYRHNDDEDTIAEGWEYLCSCDEVVGHNIIMYDLQVMCRFYGRPKRMPKVFDTLVASRLMFPDSKNHPFGGNSLENWGTFLEILKTPFDDFEEWSQEMEDYCCQDTRVNRAIYKYLLPRLAPFGRSLEIEHEVARIIANQQENGVRIDVPAAKEFEARLKSEAAVIEAELQGVFPPTITYLKMPQWWRVRVDGVRITRPSKKKLAEALKKRGHKAAVIKTAVAGPPRFREKPFNPNSTLQVANRLKEKYGYVAPLTEPDKEGKGGGRPSITEEELQSLAYPEARLLERYSMADKRLQHLADWIVRAENSRTPGVIHPQINTCGAATSRMTHQQPNQTACPKVIVGKNAEGKKAPLLGFEGRYGWECRSLWGPTRRDPSKVRERKVSDAFWVQVGVDASGLELRMLGNRMWKYDDGTYAKEVIEGDVHTLNMVSGKLVTRDQSKTCIYALLYGSGNTALGFQIANHPSLSPQQRLKYKRQGTHMEIGSEFRRRLMAQLPALKGLIDFCQKSARNNGYLQLLDGRHAPARSEHAALNTLLQGDGAIVMKVALVLAEEKIVSEGWRWGVDFAFMLNAHDEFQLECRPEIAESIAKIGVWAIEESGRRLNVRCPLTGEAKIGANWANTH